MSEINYFSSKSVFGQLISLIDYKIIKDAVKKSDSDRYVKRFKSKDHLISMLFCSFVKCNSLREVSGAMLGLSGKTESFQLSHIPKRSTLSDANKKRKVGFFEDIYNKLLLEYDSVLSDSRIQDVKKKQVKIVDSTTISLFKDILSCIGRKSNDGKSKGGIKVHTVINADEKSAKFSMVKPSETHDHNFLEKLKCDDNAIYVFDKGYNNYKAFKHFTDNQTGFVTRIKDNANHDIVRVKEVSDEIHSGVLSDEIIEIEVKEGKEASKLKVRKVKFYDRENKIEFEFITNLFELRAD